MIDFSQYRLRKGLILGFHGCDESRALPALTHGKHLRHSDNDYDWLGAGMYFWENNPERALEWAKEQGKAKPSVVGAVLDLGLCLDLTESAGCDVVKSAYHSLGIRQKLMQSPLAQNRSKARKLDCAVINHLHALRDAEGFRPYASVRAAFHEDAPLYPGAGFSERAHIQICVRDNACILGYFKPSPGH